MFFLQIRCKRIKVPVSNTRIVNRISVVYSKNRAVEIILQSKFIFINAENKLSFCPLLIAQ